MKEFGDLLCVHASLWAGIYKTDYIRNKKIKFITAKGGAYVDVGFRIDTLINTDKIAWLDKPYYNYRIDSEGSTTNNFNLPKMIERWEEAHSKFDKIKKDYDEFYGKYLVLDEYLNTLGWFHTLKLKSKYIKRISNNFNCVKNETIIESPALDKYQKREILEFKSNPQKYIRKLKEKKVLKNIAMFILRTMERIAKTWHLYCSVLFMLVSIVAKNVFAVKYAIIFDFSTKLWFFMVCFYAVDVCIYEAFHLGRLIRRKIVDKN